MPIKQKSRGSRQVQILLLQLILLIPPLLSRTSVVWAQSTNSIISTPTEETISNVPEKIVVQKFEFVGSTVFSQEELAEVTAEYIEQPITFAQLLQAANKITELYLQKGYITSGAYIPSQQIQSGTIKIQVLEGSLEEIKVNIVKGRLNPDYIRSRIALATTKPLNINRLQEALQLLQLNPLIDNIDAELTAGTKPGTNALEVTVKGAQTFSAIFQLNNNRNPSIGSFERGLRLAEANLLGWGDELSFAYSNTDGSNRFEGSYTLPVNPRNGTLRFDYRLTNNNIVEPPFDELDIEVDSREFELRFRQPVLQTANAKRSQELALSVGIARRETNSSILGVDFPLFPGADVNGETRISEVNFAQEWLQRSPEDLLAARSEFSFGIGAFDATINDNEPDSQFFLWRGQMLYLRRLGLATGQPATSPTLVLRADVQLASDSLLSREQLSIGGQPTVRGYRQDALLTDNGVIASAEVLMPVVRVPQVQGVLQIGSFIDFGIGWNVQRENPNPNTLVGIGLSLLWQMQDNFTARLDWGIPLTDIDSRDRTLQENGIYFQLEYRPF